MRQTLISLDSASLSHRVRTIPPPSGSLCGQNCSSAAHLISTHMSVSVSLSPQNSDITFIEETAAMIRDGGIPAHAPIEQRWTSTSSAAMSPASSADPKTVHSWVRSGYPPVLHPA